MRSSALKILMLTRYPAMGSSSRYRLIQYAPLFRKEGHTVEIQELLDERYLTQLYEKRRRNWRSVISGYAKRVASFSRLSKFDVVICEQEMLPFFPSLVEKFAMSRHPRFVLDYDDGAYVKYERWPILRTRIPRLMAAAHTVVVGNSHLATYARRYSNRVHIVPTVVDMSRYVVEVDEADSEIIRLVWIGMPINAEYLRLVLPAIMRLQQEYPKVRLRLIGAGDRIPVGGLDVELFDWSEETEVKLLVESDIGIMPLPDTEFSRGKCGLKLIQYMALGLPVVASPVGENNEIVGENECGFLASSEDEWFVKLEALICSAELRKRLGDAGRQKAKAFYSLEYGFSRWKAILSDDSTASRPDR